MQNLQEVITMGVNSPHVLKAVNITVTNQNGEIREYNSKEGGFVLENKVDSSPNAPAKVPHAPMVIDAPVVGVSIQLEFNPSTAMNQNNVD